MKFGQKKGKSEVRNTSNNGKTKKGITDVNILSNQAFIDAEEREIEYLEDKLNLKSDKDKKKLKNELVKEDGFDEDFVNFLDSLDHILDQPVPKNFTEKDLEISDGEYPQIRPEDISLVDDGEDQKKGVKRNYDDDGIDENDDVYGRDEIDSDEIIDSDDDGLLDEEFFKKQRAKNMKKNEKNAKKQKTEVDQEDADLLDDHFFEEESIQSNEEGSESPSENEEGSESEEEEKKEPDNDYIMINNEKVLIPKTDIYGNVLKGQEEIQQQYTQKYVPPHLRNQQTAVATPANKNNKKNALDYVDQQDKIEIKKILISGLNKLSNENFLTICQSILHDIQSYANSSIKTVLCDVILQYSDNKVKIISQFIRLYAGLIVAIGNSRKGDISAYCVEKITLKYLECYKQTLEEKSEDNAFEYSKQVHNIYLLLQFLYIYDITSSDLIMDIIEEQAKSFTNLDLELIDLMCSFIGYRIRKDNPEQLKEIILLLQKQSKEHGYNKNTITEQNMRIKLMLDHIYELKNNKQSKAVQQDMDTTVMIKRTLKRTYESQLPLNVGLFDIRNIDKNGRWWILGAQYGQKVVNENRKPLRDPSNKRTTFGNIIANCDPKILAIAKKMNMNTELRQCIIVILLTSKDFVDAYERLNQLNLKDLQQREAIKVLMECSSREKTFNPYYGLLATQLCKFNSSNRYTFQVSFWDFLSEIDSYKPLKIVNTAKLMAYILKIDFSSLSEKSILFFNEFFKVLIQTSSEETLNRIISRISVGQDQTLVCDGINLFLKMYFFKFVQEEGQILDRAKNLSKQLDRMSSMHMF